MADRSAHEEATGLDNGPPFPWDAYSGQHDGMSITFSKQINRDEEGIKPPFTLGDFNRTEPGYQSAYRFSTVFVSCTDHGDGSTGQELGNVSTPTGQQHDSGTPGSWCDVEYPVLKPLMPYIHSFLTPAHACSLLECYFASAVGQHFHPLCPYVHVFLFRKASFLAVNNPRPCSPALLASMLWVSIKSGHGSLPVWSLHERRQLSKRLYILTMQLLKPLLHADLGCLDCDFLSREHCHWKCTSKKRGRIVWAEGYFYYPPSLDDVITYIHIAAIASMSEHKATSMRWWQAAFDMARELKLNIDPCTRSTSTSPHCRPNVSGSIQPQNTTDPWSDLTSFSLEYDGINMAATDHDLSMQAGTTECDNVFSEEQREERRRIWWLLYIQDRYLALCYNRAISILDAECAELCLPMDEPTWQSGAFLGGLSTDTPIRPQFHSFECTGSNIFGFFLPLMTILGEVLDHGRNQSHPLLGLRYRGNGVSSAVENTIIHHITTYQISLTQFKTLQQTSSLRTEGYAEHDNLHIEIVIAYATYVSHVLHVLLSGKWDPLSLLDKENSWVSSPSFLKAITHALNAADVVSQILTLDPELTFMPYFLGILLLQGSLVLLMALEWLHVDSEPRVITACEAIVRATEVCMATLDTEYQVCSSHPSLVLHALPSITNPVAASISKTSKLGNSPSPRATGI